MFKICVKCKAEGNWKGKLCNKCFAEWREMMKREDKWIDKKKDQHVPA